MAGGRLQGLGSGGLGLFLEHVPGKEGMVTLELRSKQALCSKWLPRPNHFAHKISIQILSRTPVLKSRYLSSEVQTYMENSEYSQPEFQLEFPASTARPGETRLTTESQGPTTHDNDWSGTLNTYPST